MDDVARQGTATSAWIADYAALNDRFHRLLVHLARSPNLTRQLDRASALPFASPSSLLLAQSRLVDLPTMLIVAQDQHRCIVDAIEEGDGTRAEALTREHNRLATRHLDRILQSAEVLPLAPGHTLITGTSRKPIRRRTNDCGRHRPIACGRIGGNAMAVSEPTTETLPSPSTSPSKSPTRARV